MDLKMNSLEKNIFSHLKDSSSEIVLKESLKKKKGDFSTV